MMHNPLPKTVRFIFDAVVTIGVYVIHDLLCHNPNPSSRPLKMTLLVVDIGNVAHKRNRPGPFFLLLGVPAARMRRTCRHCACSISSDTPNNVPRRDSTW
jgi:hypothetical protein